jgi:hypothetical protein
LENRTDVGSILLHILVLQHIQTWPFAESASWHNTSQH